MGGWSSRNLMYMRSLADVWRRHEIVQAPLAQLPSKLDGKTIGIVLCRSRNDIVAEYALADLKKPIGVSTYQLGLPPPEQLQEKLQKMLAAPRSTKRPKAAK